MTIKREPSVSLAKMKAVQDLLSGRPTPTHWAKKPRRGPARWPILTVDKAATFDFGENRVELTGVVVAVDGKDILLSAEADAEVRQGDELRLQGHRFRVRKVEDVAGQVIGGEATISYRRVTIRPQVGRPHVYLTEDVEPLEAQPITQEVLGETDEHPYPED